MVAPGISWTENQRVAHFTDVGPVFDELKKPAAISGIAEHDGTNDLVVHENQALVDAPRRVAQHNLLTILAVSEITR